MLNFKRKRRRSRPSSRFRKGVLSNENKRGQPNIYTRVTICISGPVIFKRKPTCADTSCPLNSRCHDLHPAVCRCNDGYVFDVTKTRCQSTGGRVFKTTNLHLNKQFLPSYATTTSEDFIRLAIHVEKQLMTSYALRRDVIKG